MVTQDIILKHHEILRRLFPRASENLIAKATKIDKLPIREATACGFFLREFSYLKISMAWLSPEISILITEEERAAKFKEKGGEVIPIEVLESRSERARVCLVEEEGKIEVLEFKGLTPQKVNHKRLHPNSGQPWGMFESEPAQREKYGLGLAEGLEAKVIELGEYFGDLTGFAQLLRKAKFGKFLPWLRMDAQPTIYQILAELEEVPFETFLCQSGERMGKELRKVHEKGQTLHKPFCDELDPFYSSLHSGNVEIHGHVLDLEDLNEIEEVEKNFWQGLGDFCRRPGSERIVKKDPLGGWRILGVDLKIEQNPFSLISRSSDLQRFLGGITFQIRKEPSFFCIWRGQSENYANFLTSFFFGYYPEIREQRKEEEVKAYLKEVVKVLEERKKEYWLFPYTYQIMEEVEEELRVSI
jgi:hypothetical protein